MDFKFVGWNTNAGHDKVWGAVYLEHYDPEQLTGRNGHEVLLFWGRRGHKLQYKFDYDNADLSAVIRKKRDKGYQQVYRDQLETIYPELEVDIEKCVIIAKLKR
jgi:predicted DNA-binding WGR domain protein